MWDASWSSAPSAAFSGSIAGVRDGRSGSRKKTSVNVYMHAGAVLTLKAREALAFERAMDV